jgi:malonate decarboxylase gamma subunit
MMDWQTVADALFPQATHHRARQFLSGSAQVGGQTVAVIGTTGHTPIGVEIALAQAAPSSTPCASTRAGRS